MEWTLADERSSTTKVGRSWAVGRYPASRNIHFGDFVVLSQGELAVFVFECVDVDGSVGGLCCNILVEWVPSNSLDVVIVLSDLAYNRT